MACNELSQCGASSVPQAFLHNFQASCPRSSGEILSNFWSGAFAGLALEAGTHGARVLHTRHQQLRRGHPLGSLGIKWWVAAVRSPHRPKGPYQGALGTLAAGGIWSGIFGSAYVPVRAAVDATAPADQPVWGPAAAAAAGSLASSSVRVPLQVVKDRMERYEFFCSLQAFERILTREGLASLYSGWTRSIARNLPFDALLFVLYDTGKSKLLASREPPPQEQPQQHQLDLGSGGGGGGSGGAGAPAAAPALVPPPTQSYRLWEAAVIGGGAGAVTALITSPLEVVAAPFLGASRRATRQASPPLQASATASAASRSANRPGPASASVAPAPVAVAGGDLGSPSGRHGAVGTCGNGGGGSSEIPQGTAGANVDVRNGRAGSSSSSSSRGPSLGSTTAASDGISKISCSSNSSSSRSGGGGGGSSSHAVASLRRVGAACRPRALATALTLTTELKALATTSTTAVASASATPGTTAAAARVIATAPAPVTAATALRASSSFLAASQLTVAAARGAPPPPQPPPRRRSPLGSAPGGGGGGGPPRGPSLSGTLALRVAWAAFEGAVFFPSLEAAIPLCDWLFLPSAQGVVGLGAEVLDGSQVGNARALLRHPAHPLHW